MTVCALVSAWLAIARPHWLTFVLAALMAWGLCFIVYSGLALADRVRVENDRLWYQSFFWRTRTSDEIEGRDVVEIQTHDPEAVVPIRFVRTTASDGRAIVFSSGSMQRAGELFEAIVRHAPHARRTRIPRQILLLLGSW